MIIKRRHNIQSVFIVALLVSLTVLHNIGATSKNHEHRPRGRSLAEGDFVYYFSCPTTVGQSIQVPSGEKVRLENAKHGELCTLTAKNAKSDFVAVGRSYNGHDWESVAGPYPFLEYKCEQSHCEIILPRDTPQKQQQQQQQQQFVTYELNLMPSISPPLSKRDEIARFLEQTTFGTEAGELAEMEQKAMDTSDLMPLFTEWVHNQIYNVTATSHRAFFRRYATPPLFHRGKEGVPTRPCDRGARWRWYSFTRYDLREQLHVAKMNDRFVLSVNGVMRTMVGNLEFESNVKFRHKSQDSFTICRVEERVDGKFGILYNGQCEFFKVGNPAVRLFGMKPKPTHVLNINATKKSDFEVRTYFNQHLEEFSEILILKKTLNLDLCNSIPYPTTDHNNVYAELSNGQHLIFEPTLELAENRNQRPSIDGGGKAVAVSDRVAYCANVERNFLNEHNCKLSSHDNACAPRGKVEGSVVLSPMMLKTFFGLLNRPVYAVTGLRIEDDDSVGTPCTIGKISRWQLVDTCTENVKPETSELLGTLLKVPGHGNPNFKDITLLPEEGACHWKDVDKKQLYVKVDSQCYMNIHPDLFNVYDFTNWAELHPGGKDPIINPGNLGHHQLKFPDTHPMSRWQVYKEKLLYVGKLGDEVEFSDIPVGQLKSFEIAKQVGIYIPESDGVNTLVCGSPNEVANNELSIPRFFIRHGAQKEFLKNDEFSQQRKTIWTTIALNGKDQLRQRVAWALSQLFAISPSAVFPLNTEPFLAYYDIFVRHSFGSFRDILREVSHSPLMADMLSYHESKSSEYIWLKERTMQYADENFAREIMQLLTIGTVQLNMDGTHKIDNQGHVIPTYNNNDVEEYARVWTGFSRRGARGNIEGGDGDSNSIDPMKIRIEWRDHYPKMGLDGKYIGDGYPLCHDLPRDSFLRKGAKWKLLGKSRLPKEQDLLLRKGSLNGGNETTVVVTKLNSSSALFKNLCKRIQGMCTYPSIVELSDNLNCEGFECKLDSIKVVEVETGVFYEFIHHACIQFPFFDNGKLVSKSRANVHDRSNCVDENWPVAAAACCDENFSSIHDTCKYTGELVTFMVAKSRCANKGKDICTYNDVSWSGCGFCCNYDGYFWTDNSCNVFLIVDEKGNVSLEKDTSKDTKSYDASTFFRVHWENNNYPHGGNLCGNEICEVFGQYCRCMVHVEDTRVFSSLPTRQEILTSLHIGGMNPDLKKYAAEQKFEDITVHIENDQFPYGKSTVFEVLDDFGITKYLMNMKSIVKIGPFQFRNTPTFFNTIPEVIDAQHETEAALDHYFFHRNMAPFIAIRLIQRFGISNPSPAFIERVSSAFTNGYVDVNAPIGSRKYGDLASTIAAIILDKESRSVILDADPSYGSLREPSLKVIALMRNLRYVQNDGSFVTLQGLQEIIGQESYEMPSIFSFFFPDYAPPGDIAVSSLVSPESVLLPNAIGLINGLISTIKFGLSGCYGGFISAWCSHKEIESGGDYRASVGRLSYSATDMTIGQTIDDLATLLTSGRLSNEKRKLFKEQIQPIKSNVMALQIAQQLVISSPEYHSTGNTGDHSKIRPDVPKSRKTCKRKKTLIHIMLKGGCDSFNLLVPYSQCHGKNLYKEYQLARGSIAISKVDLLQIDSSKSNQQCKRFGLHPKLTFLQQLYDDGDALFFSGIGVLTRPVNKDDYVAKTKTQLFAHNTLQAELGRLDPNGEYIGTGMLGRLSDVLTSAKYSVNTFAVDASTAALEGVMLDSEKVSVGSKKGFQTFNPSAPDGIVTPLATVINQNEGISNNLHSKTWSKAMHEAIQRNNKFFWAYKNSKLENGWNSFPKTDIGRQLRMAAKMSDSSDCRGADRDIYYIETGSYDHHANLIPSLDREFGELNEALNAFVSEIKAKGRWDDYTIVVTSEFGRTLTPNSGKGTDHGWSGSSFIIGGQVKGGNILGQYPTDFSSTGPLNIGRGRLIPTISFESMWNGVIQWFGVNDEEDLSVILPNRKSFTNLYTETDLYVDGQDSRNINCEGYGDVVSCIPTNPDLYSDDWWAFNDDFDNDDNDEYIVGDQSNGLPVEYDDTESSHSDIILPITVVITSSFFIISAVIYGGRTGKLSKLLTALGFRWSKAQDEEWISIKSRYPAIVGESLSFEVVEHQRGKIRIIPNVQQSV